jgi:hypothetical protein
MEMANERAIYTYDYTQQIVVVRRQWPRMAMPTVRVARSSYIVCIGRLGGVRGIYVCTVRTRT